jgi:hypothetical protein
MLETSPGATPIQRITSMLHQRHAKQTRSKGYRKTVNKQGQTVEGTRQKALEQFREEVFIKAGKALQICKTSEERMMWLAISEKCLPGEKAALVQTLPAPPSIDSRLSAVLELEPVVYGSIHLLISISEQLSDLAEAADCQKTTQLAAFGACLLAQTQADALLKSYKAAHAEWQGVRRELKGGGR